MKRTRVDPNVLRDNDVLPTVSGRKALARLQEAIAQETDVLTLPVWLSRRTDDQEYRGVPARSLSQFERSGCVKPFDDRAIERTEFPMTNEGLYTVSWRP